MTSILRAYVSTRKRFFYKDFKNLERTLTYVVCNNGGSPKQLPVVYNLRCFSTKVNEKAPNRISEIYYGNLTKNIRSLKIFSLITSIGGLLFQPFFYMKAVENGNTEAVIGIFALISFIAVSTPILLNLVTKKYVTHIYYDPSEDKYIANTYNLFVVKKKLEFTPEDVVVPDVNGMFTNCIIKGTPLFLEQKFFYDPSHYIRIMGYDKPVDFKLSNNNNNSTDQTTRIDAECKDK
ncbi:transmembrane protein 70 homolog, mitochondrial [Odontomachus brunneus]|uniref:transmembrane protein 70 homolog, mitochondrial n=1 Tax=Odontomachus brunneus TaxID=486640 RepID=UPI0013F1F1AE|nr:transmembrane protein 70 homolog, mitochondrial [Odontomachus brunneus]XP_032687782.1 transmembrane protein 70 homolog, mitochondrial [Odontomachus brunneus]XP_032687787.1 transmembrane protein 70 homolog, mitochondrial [Odontomachus brunneus]